jgi:signal transduction histidine kinase
VSEIPLKGGASDRGSHPAAAPLDGARTRDWWPHLRNLIARAERERPAPSVTTRYAFATVFVLAALALTLTLQHFETGRPTLFLFFSAIVAAAWVGGVGPGCFAVAISIPAGLYFYTGTSHGFSINLDTAVLFVFFVTCATVGGLLNARQRHADQAFQDVQSELARVSRVTTMGELAVSIAHEINQPLTALVMNASACLRWLEGSPPDIGEARDAARHVIRDGNRASEVIGRIRAMVKKAPPEKTMIDVNAIVQEVIGLMRNELHKHTVTVHVELESDLPPVPGDRVQLQQVLLNLIMNAIEAMSEAAATPRVLSIESKIDGDRGIVVTVQDNGVGFETSKLDRLFDAFFTTKPNGMGLGLSICRSIIDAHGGRFWASQASPCGAAFHVALPSDGK